MAKGKLVLIEGPDGAGKTTQVELLEQELHRRGIFSKYIHFPEYSTPTGKVILEMLKGETKLMEYSQETGLLELHPQNNAMLQALFAVNRYELMSTIKTQLDAGWVVLLDRYFPSSYAYGQAQGLNIQWLYDINCEQVVPDLGIYLDVSPEETLARRPETQDLFEKDRELQLNVSLYYRRYFDAQYQFHILRGDHPIEIIHNQIMRLWDEALIHGTRV